MNVNHAVCIEGENFRVLHLLEVENLEVLPRRDADSEKMRKKRCSEMFMGCSDNF
jgi:hypothetical protein